MNQFDVDSSSAQLFDTSLNVFTHFNTTKSHIVLFYVNALKMFLQHFGDRKTNKSYKLRRTS